MNSNLANKIFLEKRPAMVFFSDEEDNEFSFIFDKVAKDRLNDLLYIKCKIEGKGLDKKMAAYFGVTKNNQNTIRVVLFDN